MTTPMEQYVGTTNAGIDVISDAEYFATIYECSLCGIEFDAHCPYCNACDYETDDCKNSFCEADLID